MTPYQTQFQLDVKRCSAKNTSKEGVGAGDETGEGVRREAQTRQTLADRRDRGTNREMSMIQKDVALDGESRRNTPRDGWTDAEWRLFSPSEMRVLV